MTFVPFFITHISSTSNDIFILFHSFVQIPDDFSITYDDVEGELVVGGVFLRLFIAQPSWVSQISIITYFDS